MPIYEYQPAGERHCGDCEQGFEQLRKASDPALTACPSCGAAVERKISAPNVPKASPSLDSDNIAKHGFTQYKRSGKGVYEKTAGKGPDIITDD